MFRARLTIRGPIPTQGGCPRLPFLPLPPFLFPLRSRPLKPARVSATVSSRSSVWGRADFDAFLPRCMQCTILSDKCVNCYKIQEKSVQIGWRPTGGGSPLLWYNRLGRLSRLWLDGVYVYVSESWTFTQMGCEFLPINSCRRIYTWLDKLL